jgi:hypothetical protein
MPTLPLRPHLKSYREGKANLQLKAAEENALAQRIADHVNRLIARDPHEIQQYFFAQIALDLGCTTEAVRSAIPAGGNNGITLRVSDEDRHTVANWWWPETAAPWETVDAFYYPNKSNLYLVQEQGGLESVDACRDWVRGAAFANGDPEMTRGDYECGIGKPEPYGSLKVYRATVD